MPSIPSSSTDPIAGRTFGTTNRCRSHLKLKLQIVGEAAVNLNSEVREAAPGIPWREIVGMRNILVHDYESVDLDILWDVVKNELPSLRSDIEDLLTRMEEGEPEP